MVTVGVGNGVGGINVVESRGFGGVVVCSPKEFVGTSDTSPRCGSQSTQTSLLDIKERGIVVVFNSR